MVRVSELEAELAALRQELEAAIESFASNETTKDEFLELMRGMAQGGISVLPNSGCMKKTIHESAATLINESPSH